MPEVSGPNTWRCGHFRRAAHKPARNPTTSFAPEARTTNSNINAVSNFNHSECPATVTITPEFY
jgi:hypothetical protein